MAIRTATKSGNLSDSTVWGATFADGDILVANGFNIALDINKIIGTSPPMRPSGAGFSAVATGTGGALATGTWYVGYTDVNANGESTMSPHVSVAVTSGQTISVTLPALPAGVVSRSIYTSVALANPTNAQRQATGITATGAGAYVQSANPSAGQSERVLGAIAISVGSTVTVNPGVTPDIRGDVNQVLGFFASQADKLIVQGTLSFNSSNATNPTTTLYQAIDPGNAAVIYLNGAVGARAAVNSITTAGALPARLICAKVRGQYVDLTKLGDASNGCIQVSSGINLPNATFDTCGDLATQGGAQVAAASDWYVPNCTFINSLGPNNFHVTFNGATQTGLRSILETVFDKRPFMSGVVGLVGDRAFFDDSATITTSETTTPAPLLNVFLRNGVTAGVVDVEGSIGIGFKDSVLVAGGVGDGSPHFVSVPAVTYDLVNDGNIIEQIGDDPSSADCFLYNVDTAAAQLNTHQNYIKLPNVLGRSSGNVANIGGAHRSFLFQHGTVHLGSNEVAGQEPSHILFEEFAGAHADMVEVRSCLGWDTTARGFLLSHNAYPSRTAVTDVALVAKLHHNGTFNASAAGSCDYSDGTAVVTPRYSGLKFSGAQATKPGANDVVEVDPQFVDPTRCLSKWDWSLAAIISLPVTLASSGANLARATRTAHGLQAGDWVTIGGAVTAAYNVTARIVASTANTFDYAVVGTLGADSGAITKQGAALNAIAQLKKRNLSTFDSRYTVTAYLTYVRAGFTPQATAYKGTAHDGTDIGAVAVALASPVATTLLVTAQPGAIASGARHGTPVAVQVLDQFGAPFQEALRYVAAVLLPVTGDATAAGFGTSNIATTAAVSTFTGLYAPDGLGVVSMAGGTYKWRFTSYRRDPVTFAVVPGSTIGPFDSATFAVAADVHAFNAGVLTVAKLLYPLPDSPTLDIAAILPKPSVPNGGGYEATFDYYRDQHWTTETTPPGSGDGSQLNGFYYDAALVDYARAERCKLSDPARSAVMYARGDQELKWYRDQYVLPNNGQIAQHWMFYHGLAIHYLRTQDYASRLAIELLGRWAWQGRMWTDANANALVDMPNNVRPTTRAYQGVLFCSWLGIPDATAGPLVPGTTYSQGTFGGSEPPPWSQCVAFYRPLILAYSSTGRYPGTEYCGHNANFLIGMLAEAIIDDWYISGLTVGSVLPVLQAIADYLTTEWVTAQGGFHYLDGQCDAATGVGSDSTAVAADLTGLMVVVLAWVRWRTAGAGYAVTAADAINKMVVNGYQPGHKQFNQLYRSSYKAVAYMALPTPPGTADHLTITTQPAGAVSGVPMTTQPAGTVADVGGLTVASDASTVFAQLVVESGIAVAIGTQTVPVVNGLWAFASLGAASTLGATAHWHFTDGALVAVDSAPFAISVASAVSLVESPTHLDQPTRVGKVGDTITITETLRGRDKKTPQDLTGATVTFSLAGPDNALLITDAPATILDATAGRVRYVIAASVAVPAGACTFAFRATWDADTVLSFPDA